MYFLVDIYYFLTLLFIEFYLFLTFQTIKIICHKAIKINKIEIQLKINKSFL